MRKKEHSVSFPCSNAVIRALFLICSLSCLAVQLLSAQADFEKGYQAYQTYHGSDFDHVNLANGNLILNIPLLSYEQRGGLPPIVIAIRSNSTTFQAAPPFSSGPPDTQQSEVSSGVIGSPWGQPHVMISPGGLWWKEVVETVNGTQYARYEAIDDSGGVHSLAGNITNTLAPSLGSIRYSIDGSDYMLTAAASPLIIDRKGNTGGLADPNGNAIQLKGLCAQPVGSGLPYTPTLANWQGYAYGTASATSIVDSIGRQIPNPTYVAPYGTGCLIDTDTSYYPSSTTNSSSCPALESGASGAVSESYAFPDANNKTVSLTFCYQQISIHAELPNVSNGTTTINETWPVLTAAILPNGTSWVFTYDSWGQVSTVKMPTGAVVSYAYGTSSHPTRLACGLPPGEVPNQGAPTWPVNNIMSSRPVTKRTVTVTNPAGTEQTEQWSYASTIGSGWQNSPDSGTVTVTDGLGNDTVHTFTLIGNPTTGQPVCGPYESQTKYYQGSKSSGTLLKQVATTYTSIGTDEANPLNFTNYIAIGVFPSSVTTTLPVGGGASSQIQQETETYDQFGTYQGYTGTTYNFGLGIKLADTESDWGAAKAGAVLRTNQYVNQWESNWHYYAKNLVDLPCLVTTYSGAQSGTVTSCAMTTSQASQTQYLYDESAYVPSGKIGLLTTATRWLKSGTSPSSHTAYNTQGMPTIKYDPNGNQTLIAYDSSGLYPNKITHPQTGSTAHVEIPAYDDATGELSSHIDENNNKTSFTYDSMRRLLTATYPTGGGSETFTYIDAIPPSYTFARVLNASSTYTEAGLADTIGRKTQTQVTSDTQGTMYADTTYDDLGRVATQSNPYRTKTDTTYGVTAFAYDAIGRKTIQTQPDSSAQQWCYMDLVTNTQTNCNAQLAKTGSKTTSTGSFVDFMDESGNDWQRTSDGLGRLASVMEPNGVTATPSMQTTYTYDILGDLTNVAQPGNTSTDKARAARQFTYDTLSRLSTALNPESGSMSYTYDPNGNMLTREQPLVNASSGTQTLNFCYDALNRKVYEYIGSPILNCIASPPSTPNLISAYTYDTTSLGTAPNYAIGHLTDEIEYAAGTGTAAWERSPYQFDTMDRLLNEQQCAFGSCTTTYPFAYSYDYAGNILSTSNGLASASPITIGYTYDSVARLATVTSTTPATGIWAGTGFPSTLYTATSYGPAGLVSATYGKSASTLSRGYDNRLRTTSNSISATSTLYQYSLTYAPNNNIATVSDSIVGDWTYAYDTLNRLTSATASAAGMYTPFGTFKTQCWTYDGFGNRTGEGEMAKAAACPNPVTGADHSSWAQYNISNQLTANSTVANFLYDDAGNTINDGINKYVYDLDGRVCAVTTVAGGGTVTQYVYDAESRRVAKGSLTAFPASGATCSAPTTAKGFTATSIYLRGQSGRQDTELNGSGAWVHTNVFVRHHLIATYDTGNKATLSFNFHDWLGTKRVQSNFSGAAQNSWTTDPFGAYLHATGSGAEATEHHFTDKEHDGETANDYFTARYYQSGIGRWVLPDKPFADQHSTNPQSWDLFGYARNNPLSFIDTDGFRVLDQVVAEAVQKMTALKDNGGGRLYLDHAGIKGLSSKQSMEAGTFNGWHSDHSSENSVVIPNDHKLGGLPAAFIGKVDRDQADTSLAIIKAWQANFKGYGVTLATDSHSNGVNALAWVSRQVGAGVFDSATIVAPNTMWTSTLKDINNATMGPFEVYLSTNDPALAAAGFGIPDPDAVRQAFGDDAHISSQWSHHVFNYWNANGEPKNDSGSSSQSGSQDSPQQ